MRRGPLLVRSQPSRPWGQPDCELASKQRRAHLTSLSRTGSGLVSIGSYASMANLTYTLRRLIRSGNSLVKAQPCSRFGALVERRQARPTNHVVPDLPPPQAGEG